ncbi:hypothetical protein ANCDUO_04191 [Ancylostoma duodenale]|uniref:Uncharacterized protein n=1 Tax=Ancylostoma duodenale TaxID=51022 RepID=A0A0C2GVM3_9BILA|nr:hypothetical protein ANCDUO_04191 [Ancylostoma duodenale]
MPSTRKTTFSQAATNSRTTKANPTSSVTPSKAAASPESAKEEVTLRLRSILNDKAPEALPLLDQLLDMLRLDPCEIIESEKRARSIVIAGVAEAEGELVPVDRQAHTEAMTCRVLNALGVEARPTEIYRMGDYSEGEVRLIKCVLPSERFFHKALRNAPTLRNLRGFDRIFIRRSMTREEREREKDLRRQAHELNAKDHNGAKIYVV